MKLWVVVVVSVINLASICFFLILLKEIRRKVISHTQVLGPENRSLVNSSGLRVLEISYFVTVVVLAIGSYLVFI